LARTGGTDVIKWKLEWVIGNGSWVMGYTGRGGGLRIIKPGKGRREQVLRGLWPTQRAGKFELFRTGKKILVGQAKGLKKGKELEPQALARAGRSLRQQVMAMLKSFFFWPGCGDKKLFSRTGIARNGARWGAVAGRRDRSYCIRLMTASTAG
jgi:hypothetical protein